MKTTFAGPDLNKCNVLPRTADCGSEKRKIMITKTVLHAEQLSALVSYLRSAALRFEEFRAKASETPRIEGLAEIMEKQAAECEQFARLFEQSEYPIEITTHGDSTGKVR